MFYHSAVAYVRPYKKAVPACFLCGNIGHRPSAGPLPTPGRCTRWDTQVQVTPEGLAQHEFNATCLLCAGPHQTSSRGYPGKYRKPTQPSTPKPPAPHHRAPTTQAASQLKRGSRLQTPATSAPTTSVHYPSLVAAPLQVISWPEITPPRPLPPSTFFRALRSTKTERSLIRNMRHFTLREPRRHSR
ncbi:hypothetical protein HPB49_019090 [Dermacentor silvarum]|uniref:Uncharacterized protein n=1 Tax=Dermacentor silvarum TaxID=543639 RepID=A0ACB8CH14_DERSI|nr:hypothetical protein HPB49_019090 [Dermacentor silvarum]